MFLLRVDKKMQADRLPLHNIFIWFGIRVELFRNTQFTEVKWKESFPVKSKN